MSEIEDNILSLEQARKKRSRLKLVRKLLIFLTVLIMAVLMILVGNYFKDVDYESLLNEQLLGSGAQTFPVSIPAGKALSLQVKGSNLAVGTSTGFLLLDKNGKRINVLTHAFTNPQIALGKNRQLYYDLGGRDLLIYSGSRKLHNIRYDFPIYGALLSGNDTMAVVTGSERYIAQMSILDKSFTTIYEWYSYETNVVDMSFSKNSSAIAVGGLTAENGAVKTSIYLFKLNKEKEVFKKDFPGITLIKVDYKPNGRIYVVTDAKLIVLDEQGETVMTYDYGGRQLLSYSTGADDVTLLQLRELGQVTESNIVAVDIKGELINQRINLTVRQLNIDSKGVVAIITAVDGVYVCPLEGDLKGTLSLMSGSSGFVGSAFIGGDIYTLDTNAVSKLEQP